MRPIAVLLALSVAAACRSAAEAPAAQYFVSIAKGLNSGITTPGTLVARDENQWRALWDQHVSVQVPRPPAPQIDFQHSLVLFVSAGARPSGGYGLAVERVEAADGKLFVSARESTPLSGAITTAALTAPFEIVIVPRSELPVETWIRH